MGRATITGGGDEGLYTAQIEFNTESAKKTVEAINAEIEEIDEEIELLEVKIEEVEGELREKTDAREALHNDYNVAAESARLKNEEAVTHPEYVTFEGKEGAAPNKMIGDWIKTLKEKITLGDLLDAYFEETFGRPYEGTPALSVEFAGESAKKEVEDAGKAAPPPSDEEMKEKFGDFLAALAEEHAVQDVLLALEKMVAMREYQKEALEKRKEKLQAAVDELDERSMWCADLTEDLSGGVDTIEVIGSPDQILIGPGGTNALKDAEGGVGKLTNIITMSAAQSALGWALLPGWQKWRPTYRVGVIHDIDYKADTASVTLDAAVSIAQDLNINQSLELVDIPVEYMKCDADAFENGDRVVVEFAGQLWEQEPKVIGFETHPQPCGDFFPAIYGTTTPNSDALFAPDIHAAFISETNTFEDKDNFRFAPKRTDISGGGGGAPGSGLWPWEPGEQFDPTDLSLERQEVVGEYSSYGDTSFFKTTPGGQTSHGTYTVPCYKDIDGDGVEEETTTEQELIAATTSLTAGGTVLDTATVQGIIVEPFVLIYQFPMSWIKWEDIVVYQSAYLSADVWAFFYVKRYRLNNWVYSHSDDYLGDYYINLYDTLLEFWFAACDGTTQKYYETTVDYEHRGTGFTPTANEQLVRIYQVERKDGTVYPVILYAFKASDGTTRYGVKHQDEAGEWVTTETDYARVNSYFIDLGYEFDVDSLTYEQFYGAHYITLYTRKQSEE